MAPHGLGRAPLARGSGKMITIATTQTRKAEAPQGRILTMAMSWETTMHSTMIFRLVTTFHRACFMAFLLQLVGGVFTSGLAHR